MESFQLSFLGGSSLKILTGHQFSAAPVSKHRFLTGRFLLVSPAGERRNCNSSLENKRTRSSTEELGNPATSGVSELHLNSRPAICQSQSTVC